MTAPDINTELICVIASLGYNDGDEYFKGADCLSSLKDLARFLRREDETCNIRRQMGSSQLVQKDLLPMFIYLTDDDELTDIVIRLIVNLTSPADICFNKNPDEAEEAGGKIKKTNTLHTKYLEVVQYLQAYKEAFTSEKVMAALGTKLGKILQVDMEERSEDDMILFERLLLLLRNILHVPSSPDEEMRTEDDVSLHDQVLWNMHLNGIDDLLVYITSSPDEGRWSMHAVEIINLMLREQDPEKLSNSSQQRSQDEKMEDTRTLVTAKEREDANKKANRVKAGTSRHSRFGGSFWVMNMKGVGNKNTLVHHKHVKDVDDITFDHKKHRGKIPKRQQDAKDTTLVRKSTLNIRLFLKEFCAKLLEHSYNSLMRTVKINVVSKRTQENDDSYYLWSMRFFMAFNRALSFKVEFVSETLNMNAFHYILKQLNTYYDQFIMHKRGGWEPWQKRLHLALQSYKEILTYLAHMDKADDSVLKEVSSMIKSNVFYHEEYRSIFLILLRHFDNTRQTRKYLTDLVDTFHIFLRLLERFCKSKGSLLVKSKKKIPKRRKKKSVLPSVSLTAEQLEELWENELAPTLSGLLQGHEAMPEQDHSPFDPSLDIPVDEQSHGAVYQIQRYLRENRCGDAVSLIRASRECWPSDERFGGADMSPEEEFMLVRDLLMKEAERPPYMNEDEAGMEEGEEENEEVDEELEESRIRSIEREFNLDQFLRLLASPQILMPYNLLFKNFIRNSSSTNHAIVKMLHRIAVDLKFPEMLFQLSTFLTFKNILHTESKRDKELAKFAKYIINKFVSAAEENPKLFVECFFWKGTGDSYQISNREDPTHVIKAREKWTFEDEEELRTLFDQFKDSEDVVGEILKHITDKDRTRRQISNKLVRLKMVENAKHLPKPKKIKLPAWSEEQTEELHRIYDEMKTTIDPVGNIMNALSFEKSKQAIIRQLLETGKVSDRSELKKKKRKKNQEFKDLVNEQRDDEYVSDHWSSEESDAERERPSVSKPISNVKKKSMNWFSDSESEVSSIESDNENEAAVGDTEAPDYDNNTSVQSLLIELKREGFGDQLSWLRTRLIRAAEGREEDDDWYPVPLLTMTEEDENALEDKQFSSLLRRMKLKPPADEQEAFWRIPDSLSPVILRENVTKIENCLNGDMETAENNSEVSSPVENGIMGSPPNSVGGKSKNAGNGKGRKRRKGTLQSDSDNEIETNEKLNNRRKRKRMVIEESTQDIDDDIPLHMLGNTQNTHDPGNPQSSGGGVQNMNGSVKQSNFEQKPMDGESTILHIDDRVPLNELPNIIESKREKEFEAASSQEAKTESVPYRRESVPENISDESHNQSALNFSLRLSEEEEIAER